MPFCRNLFNFTRKFHYLHMTGSRDLFKLGKGHDHLLDWPLSRNPLSSCMNPLISLSSWTPGCLNCGFTLGISAPFLLFNFVGVLVYIIHFCFYYICDTNHSGFNYLEQRKLIQFCILVLKSYSFILLTYTVGSKYHWFFVSVFCFYFN